MPEAERKTAEAERKTATPGRVAVSIIKSADISTGVVTKSDAPTQITAEDAFGAGTWLTHLDDQEGLKELVRNSSILPQCIKAYKANICGFGLEVKYINDVSEKDITPEMEAEKKLLEEVLELLTIESDTKTLFENVVSARETFGTAYVEVIRNLEQQVVQCEFIKETPSIFKTQPLEPYIPYTYFHHGKETVRKKKFCRYMQQLGGKTVYYKEFGDPRIMDNRTGKYVPEGESLEVSYHANEILQFSIGTETYGEVRWIGQVLGIDGSRRAEGLNNNYFRNGRHTPLLIMVKGGSLTQDSFDKLQLYMNDIKGESGQHAFIVLSAEPQATRTDFDDETNVDIEVKDLASILQKDELFQEYLDNNRRRVQSAFQLPDLYVGYTTDFNRATAQTAMVVTEQQVFQPERRDLEWIINNKLLNCYELKYVYAHFKEPDINNADDLYKILTIAERAGGVTPNKARQIAAEALGDRAEAYEGEWGDIPLSVQAKISQAQQQATLQKLDGQIAKAARESAGEEVVTVMKEVRRLLVKMAEGEKNSD